MELVTLRLNKYVGLNVYKVISRYSNRYKREMWFVEVEDSDYHGPYRYECEAYEKLDELEKNKQVDENDEQD